MTEFLVLYHASKSAKEKFGEMSPEEMSKTMEAWMKWAENCGEHLVDMGAPLGNGKHLDTTGSTSSSSEVGGYSIMQADNVAKIEELLKENPHLKWGNGFYAEIHEKMPLPKC